MLCNAPTWSYKVGKESSMKAAIAMYVVDASRQCMSVSLILGFNLDFSSCDNLVGFCESSHISYMHKFRRQNNLVIWQRLPISAIINSDSLFPIFTIFAK